MISKSSEVSCRLYDTPIMERETDRETDRETGIKRQIVTATDRHRQNREIERLREKE